MVIDHGIVIATGTPTELKRKAGADRVELGFKSATELTRAAKLFADSAVFEEDLILQIPAKNGVGSLTSALNSLEKSHIRPDTAQLRRPTLDDVFLALTGHESTEHAKEKK